MSKDIQENSPSEQRQALTDFAKKHGYKIVGEYLDEGISGDSTEKRLGFQQMMADCPSKRFDAVLCWDQDRFGRFDPLEAGFWIKPMRDAGVKLVTIAQGVVDWNDFAGRLVWSVNQESKHSFLRDIARNTLRGNLARVRSGKFSGRPPFGYVMGDDGRLALGDPVAVATVQRVFELRRLRFGFRLIATQMMATGYESPSGRTWSLSAVRAILARELYSGTLIFGRRHTGKYSTFADGAVVPAKNGVNRQPVRIPDAHPAIVDLDTWNEVVALKGQPKPFSTFSRTGAPFSGLLICGNCGSAMYSNGPRYICGMYMRGRGCGHCDIRKEIIHPAVMTALQDTYCGGSLDALTEILEGHQKRSASAKPVAHKRALLDKLDRQIKAAMQRLLSVDNRLFAELETQVLAMRDQRDSLAAELVEATQKPKRSALTIAKELWGVVTFERPADPITARNVMRRVIDNIRLDFKESKTTKVGVSFECIGGKVVFKAEGTPSINLPKRALR